MSKKVPEMLTMCLLLYSIKHVNMVKAPSLIELEWDEVLNIITSNIMYPGDTCTCITCLRPRNEKGFLAEL